MTNTHTQPEDDNNKTAVNGQDFSSAPPHAPAVSPPLFTPLKAPEVSGNLLADPRIAALLQPPTD